MVKSKSNFVKIKITMLLSFGGNCNKSFSLEPRNDRNNRITPAECILMASKINLKTFLANSAAISKRLNIIFLGDLNIKYRNNLFEIKLVPLLNFLNDHVWSRNFASSQLSGQSGARQLSTPSALNKLGIG